MLLDICHPQVATCLVHGENKLIGGNTRSEAYFSHPAPRLMEVSDVEWNSNGPFAAGARDRGIGDEDVRLHVSVEWGGEERLVSGREATVLRLRAGKYAEARDLFQRSLAIWEASSRDGLDAATALNNLGVANLYLHEYERARNLTARALHLRRLLLPSRHSDVAQSLYNYAVALEKSGQRKGAREAFREAAASRSAFTLENYIGLTVDIKALEKR